MPLFRIWIAFLALAAASTPLIAGKPVVAVQSQAFVERVRTDANGRAQHILAMPQQVAHGDRLVFVVRYRNLGRAPVNGFAVTNPVPATLRIDASQPAMQVSVDHGRTWGRLDSIVVATPLGGTRRATADDITDIRWTVPQPIQPGDEGRISYRATVR